MTGRGTLGCPRARWQDPWWALPSSTWGLNAMEQRGEPGRWQPGGCAPENGPPRRVSPRSSLLSLHCPLPSSPLLPHLWGFSNFLLLLLHKLSPLKGQMA